ncbi:MAG: CoA-binding protein [Clostridiales bacterium]|jgi:predicted CoA-binding protein|nr:CoA-binding protein [Eubacteriales bacterium]MDH7566485.1 CoA-binding protein [Clostridiales bacterium]
MQQEVMLEKRVWAVVGASNNPEKYGNKIYRRLKSEGFRVYAVNPNHETVEGDRCYRNLASLPEKPEVVGMVVSPENGRPVIEEAARLGIGNIWLQPGTYDRELLDLIREKGLNAVQACVLTALG